MPDRKIKAAGGPIIMGCGQDGQKEVSNMDDLRRIGYGSDYLQEDDEVSWR